MEAPSVAAIAHDPGYRGGLCFRPGENPDLWFPDAKSEELTPGSAATILPLLLCDACPARRHCLERGMAPIVVPGVLYLQASNDRQLIVAGSRIAPEGIWGGTTERDRSAVADLPVHEAVDLLERTHDRRMQERIRIFEQAHAARQADASTRVTKRERRAHDLLVVRAGREQAA